MLYFYALVPVEPKLTNVGEDCWWHCWGKQGHCSWCGTEGMCCTMKDGWTDTSNGCDGTFGGYERHECSARPGKFLLFNSVLTIRMVKFQTIIVSFFTDLPRGHF